MLTFDHITNNTFDIFTDEDQAYRASGDDSLIRLKTVEVQADGTWVPGETIAELRAPKGWHFSRQHVIDFAKAVLYDKDSSLEAITGWE